MNNLNVYELQGLYGSYSVPELVPQYIWHYGDFNHKELRTQSGKTISILIDALLPLIEPEKLMDTETIWLDWCMGDKPNASTIYLNQLLSKQSRRPNRNAWVQGLYNLLIKQFSRMTKIPNEHSQRDASMVHFRP